MGVLKFLLGAIGVLLMLAYSAVYLYSGGAGIYAWGGSAWLSGCILAFVILRIAFPFTLGAFYCAAYLWGWHWSLATVWALPGLAVALPGMLAGAVSLVAQFVAVLRRA
jgi:hypothetical protein